jgi:flavin-dependent dehydrogenase
MVEMSTVLEAYSQHIGDAELYFRHRVTKINATPEKVSVEVSTPEGVSTCSGKILAACDGVNSISKRTFGGPKSFMETEYYFDGVKADVGCFQNFHTHKYSPDGLYLCIFHISPTQVVVVIGIGEQPQPAKPLLDTFIREHPAAQELGLRQGKVSRRVGGVTALSKGRLLQGRVIFLGDAGAGFPWLGGMMYDGAMKTADITSQSIVEALETNDPGCLKMYEAAWDEAFAHRFELEAAVVAALRQLTDEEIDAVIADFKGIGSLRKAFIAAAEGKRGQAGQT